LSALSTLETSNAPLVGQGPSGSASFGILSIVVGREALNTRIKHLQEHFGELSFIVNGSIEHHNGYASYQWAQPATAKSDEVHGWDVLHFDGDLIDCLVMFIPGYEKLNVPGHTVD
jgi:hypothetical protein